MSANANASPADGQNIIIALDPGHGGDENGADYYGEKEKDVDLKIAEFVKNGLEDYDNVTVVVTRDGDEKVGLKERADRAAAAGADIFISLHCNASVSHVKHGASVYISTGEGKRDELKEFADFFVGELEAIGLNNAGIFARMTEMGRRREDGSFDDYYGVLRHSYNNGIPALLVEHCFMDSPVDWKYIRDDYGIEKLAKADVKAIVAFYGLTKKDGTVYYGKHSGMYKVVEKAPQINSVNVTDYDGKSPGMITYEVDVTDDIGINYMYLVYKNAEGKAITISPMIDGDIKTGKHKLKAYIPEGNEGQRLTLQFIAGYNEKGFDIGYNRYGGEMVGFGMCSWQNSFAYNGEADLNVLDKGVLSEVYMNKLNEQINLGLKSRQREFPYEFRIKKPD